MLRKVCPPFPMARVSCTDRDPEFYNTSQYGRDYVIGRNCRFLQGPKTSNASVRRMIDALTTGQEITETILNYRRDGTPFMNLLLIAPLYDNKGQVRYFLGCQIDVSSLVEGGRGIESFAQLLAQDRSESRFGGSLEKDPKHKLGELGQVLTEDEANIVKGRSRRQSEESPSRPDTAMSGQMRAPRRRLGMDDGPAERAMWPHPNLGPSGRLPGVYQNVSIDLHEAFRSIANLMKCSTCSSGHILRYASLSPHPRSVSPVSCKPNSSIASADPSTSAKASSTRSPTAQASQPKSAGSRTARLPRTTGLQASRANQDGSTALRCLAVMRRWVFGWLLWWTMRRSLGS